MLPIFIQHAGQEAVPALPGPYPGLRAETEIARRREGPFSPLALALAGDASVRESFARALALPEIETWAKARLWLLIGLVPWLMLAELDRELSGAGFSAAATRLVGDLLLAVIAAVDIARPLPRHPRTTAAILIAGAARYALFVARACGHGIHPTIFIAPIVAATGGLLLLRHAPRPARVADAILERLGVSRAEVAAVRASRVPSRAHVAAAVAAAMGLPLALAATRPLGVWPQAAVFAAYAFAAPLLVARTFERGAHRARFAEFAWRPVLGAAVVGLGLTVGLANGAHYAFDAGAYATRCVSSGAFEGAPRRALDAEGRDVEKNVQNARTNVAYFFMTVLVVPLAEERVFRAMLQRILARRFGEGRAIALSSLAFGLAHLGVYKVAVYQTVLLGVGFGVAFSGGGYVAAVLAHALWNLSLVL